MDEIGQEVAIIGGGSTGCELGIELARRGKNVTILEMGDILAKNSNILYRIGLRQALEKESTLHTKLNIKVVEIARDGVVYEEAGKQKFIPASTVILSTGMRTNPHLIDSFYGIVPDTFVIGDANKPRNVMDATREGYFIAKNL